MSTAMDLARLRRLRITIENAQAHVKELTDRRDVIIADLLIAHAATGDVIGKNAGVSQPRTVQIKNTVIAQRELESGKSRRRRKLRVVEAS
jgi:hypothetical protein